MESIDHHYGAKQATITIGRVNANIPCINKTEKPTKSIDSLRQTPLPVRLYGQQLVLSERLFTTYMRGVALAK